MDTHRTSKFPILEVGCGIPVVSDLSGQFSRRYHVIRSKVMLLQHPSMYSLHLRFYRLEGCRVSIDGMKTKVNIGHG